MQRNDCPIFVILPGQTLVQMVLMQRLATGAYSKPKHKWMRYDKSEDGGK